MRAIISQMEEMDMEMDTHGIANREILFMHLLVLLRKSSLQEGAANNDARLNQLMLWLEDHFAEDICWESTGGAIYALSAHAAPPA